LRVHVRNHKGEKPDTCYTILYFSVGNVKAHGEKTLKCDSCGAQLSRIVT